jgi:hypothetical protein
MSIEVTIIAGIALTIASAGILEAISRYVWKPVVRLFKRN